MLQVVEIEIDRPATGSLAKMVSPCHCAMGSQSHLPPSPPAAQPSSLMSTTCSDSSSHAPSMLWGRLQHAA